MGSWPYVVLLVRSRALTYRLIGSLSQRVTGINKSYIFCCIHMLYRYLYWMFVAIDVCFHLKRRLVSSALKDPALGNGWAYFVEDALFREFLLTVTDQEEVKVSMVFVESV